MVLGGDWVGVPSRGQSPVTGLLKRLLCAGFVRKKGKNSSFWLFLFLSSASWVALLRVVGLCGSCCVAWLVVLPWVELFHSYEVFVFCIPFACRVLLWSVIL